MSNDQGAASANPSPPAVQALDDTAHRRLAPDDETFDVGVDLDGVVYDFVSSLADFAASHLRRPRHEFPPAQCWNFFSDQWQMSVDEYLELFAAGVHAREVLWHGEPYPDVVASWQALAAQRHRIHVITDRAPPGAQAQAQQATLHWLATHGLVFDTLTFTYDKTVIRSVARGPRVVFIDDKPDNVHALAAADVDAYCLARPWNRGHPFRYVASFADFVSLVLAR